MKFTIENLSVSSLSHDNTRAAINWQNKAANERLHIWVELPSLALGKEPSIHVNPIEPTTGKFGRSEHRTRDPNSKAQRPLLDAVLEQVRTHGLVAQAIEAAKARELAEEADRQNKMAIRRKEEAGPALYAALDALLDCFDENGQLAETSNGQLAAAIEAADRAKLQAETAAA